MKPTSSKPNIDHYMRLTKQGVPFVNMTTAVTTHSIDNRELNYCLLCSLAGALGLEKLTEALVGALAEAAGVSQPAPPGTPAEAKQVAALEGLLQLAMGPRAGLLGSGWVLVLRTLSALEALQVPLTIT